MFKSMKRDQYPLLRRRLVAVGAIAAVGGLSLTSCDSSSLDRQARPTSSTLAPSPSFSPSPSSSETNMTRPEGIDTLKAVGVTTALAIARAAINPATMTEAHDQVYLSNDKALAKLRAQHQGLGVPEISLSYSPADGILAVDSHDWSVSEKMTRLSLNFSLADAARAKLDYLIGSGLQLDATDYANALESGDATLRQVRVIPNTTIDKMVAGDLSSDDVLIFNLPYDSSGPNVQVSGTAADQYAFGLCTAMTTAARALNLH